MHTHQHDARTMGSSAVGTCLGHAPSRRDADYVKASTISGVVQVYKSFLKIVWVTIVCFLWIALSSS